MAELPRYFLTSNLIVDFQFNHESIKNQYYVKFNIVIRIGYIHMQSGARNFVEQ